MRLAMYAQLSPDSVSTVAHSTGLIGIVTTVVGAFGYLPVVITCIAGVFAAISYAITVYESVTIQTWLTQHRLQRKTRKLNKLRQQQIRLTAKVAALEVVAQASRDAKQIIADSEQGVLTPKSSRPQ